MFYFKKKSFHSQLISAVLFLLTIGVHAAPIPTKVPGILNVASYSAFKPVSYGHGEGFEADLLSAIAQLWQTKIAFHPYDVYQNSWLLPLKKDLQIDIALGGYTPAPYRRKQGAVFSQKTSHFNQSLLIRRKNSKRITSYLSFKNQPLKIGVVPGTTGEYFAYRRAKENHLSPTVFVRGKSESELLKALGLGTIDAIARGDIGNEYQAAQHPKFIVIAKKNYGEAFSFSVDPKNPLLLEKLNQAINLLTQQGKITYQDWLANPKIFQERVRYLQQDLGAGHSEVIIRAGG